MRKKGNCIAENQEGDDFIMMPVLKIEPFKVFLEEVIIKAFMMSLPLERTVINRENVFVIVEEESIVNIFFVRHSDKKLVKDH